MNSRGAVGLTESDEAKPRAAGQPAAGARAGGDKRYHRKAAVTRWPLLRAGPDAAHLDVRIQLISLFMESEPLQNCVLGFYSSFENKRL